MAKAKYFGGIATAQADQQAQNQNTQSGALEPFDFSLIGGKTGFSRIAGNVSAALIAPAYAFSRRFIPLLPLAGLIHVTRDAQVRDILSRPDDFPVPFGPEMKELGNGATFLLGLEGTPHDRLHAILTKAIKREDAARFADMSQQFSKALLENSSGRLDVIADLLKRVPAEICVRYFGLSCDDIDSLGDWTIALSALLFGDPFGNPDIRRLAMNARRRLVAVIDDAIVRTQRLVKTGAIDASHADTLVARLVLIQQSEPLSDHEIRAMLLGMATGFIPTNMLASANMLAVLLDHPDAMAMAQRAAREGDRVTMQKIVLEAGRLNPALSPGQWRLCPNDTTIEVDGKKRRIKAGTTLLVSTMSAMRDPRAWDDPKRFRLDRIGADGTAKFPDLLFGIGPHACIGKHLAMAQITELFIALLSRDNLKPAKGAPGRLARVGPFPRHLVMTYDTPAAQQSMFMVFAPVTSGASKSEMDKTIAQLGHPAGAAVRAALDKTGLVHFASLTSILTDNGLFLAFELSTDGTIAQAVAEIAACAGDLLRPVFAHAGLSDEDMIEEFLNQHVVELHGKPWGANGLNFNGLPEFPVSMVEKQARFSNFAGRVLRDYVATETARGSHPQLAMAHLRRILRNDPAFRTEATVAQKVLMAESAAEQFDAYHMTTDAARFKLARYRAVSHGQAFFNFLKSPDGRVLMVPLFVAFAFFAWVFWPSAATTLIGKIVAVSVKATLATLLAATALLALFLFRLRRIENRDVPDISQAPLEKLHAMMAQENALGHAQNHILAVGTMKKGWFRAFTHAFALWGIRILIVYGFRPGFVINMGTIHYARWWRLPGTDKVCFYSNFDGSWESYLEDFITRARQGQTAAWSNWEGFPRTRFMIGLGAENGDAFKRWVRIQQQLVPFWYSRFPDLSSEQIRTNALIHTGASLARTATESEEWMRCFGSMPRVDNRIESDEVQALVFRGMKRLAYSAAIAIRLPEPGEPLGEWLCWVRGRPMQAEVAGGEAEIESLVNDGVLVPVPRPGGRPPEHALAHALTIAFGDRPLTGDDETVTAEAFQAGTAAVRDASAATSRAVFLALSAAGLTKFQAPNVADGTLLDGFPYAFRMGMAARDRINGDRGRDAPGGWRWQDDARENGATEAMLMLYAASPEQLDRMAQVHIALLENHGGAIVSQTNCAPAWAEPEKADFEHFGYRDGISQPVIRGTLRALRGVPDRDVVEPGEFILGYKSGQGFFPPSPQLPPEADMSGALPVTAEGTLSRFPDFGDKSLNAAPRDLGRNGTYLVIRELRQDVDAFEACIDKAVEQLTTGSLTDLYRLVGQSPDREWVKAKLMGRWPNGRPLIGCPINKPSSTTSLAAEMENDFSYGEDDPQGLACPFGSHIRRTNPRDSKQPGDTAEQFISNRHRLLRRGRTYTRHDGEKGLLFVSLCTDIERQFEFVQQFWANAPAFHGLDNEPDPFVGSDPLCAMTSEAKERVFTIPTPAGPLRITGLNSFVQTMAGGYFFLPSRSALGWLSDISLHAPQAGTISEHKDAAI